MRKNLFSPKEVIITGLFLSVIIPVLIQFSNSYLGTPEYLPIYLGIGLATVTIALSLIINNQNRIIEKVDFSIELQKTEISLIKEAIGDLNEAFLRANKVKIIVADRPSLYKKLKTKANISKRVSLTYMAKMPPLSSSYNTYDTKKEYLEFLNKEIQENKKFIKRIVLYTEHNKEWIKKIVDAGEGKDKFSLSILKDDSKVPRVPFQMIGDNTLIILGKIPGDSSIKRDIIIESKDLIETYEVYYEKIWKSDNCHQIMENGHKNIKNYNEFLCDIKT